MSLITPFSVQKLQTALHAKAKESPDFRFHALYDKVYRKDVLVYAYNAAKPTAALREWTAATTAVPALGFMENCLSRSWHKN
jgi:hypothetical protein